MENSDNNEMDENMVLLNTFLKGKRRYKVFYCKGSLIWEGEKSKKGHHVIPINDVISVKTQTQVPRSANTQQVYPIPTTSTSPLSNEQRNFSAEPQQINDSRLYRSLTVNYAKLVKSANIWRVHSITFHNSDKRIVKMWHDTLNGILDSQQRPKKLLLFLNPFSGSKNALSIYKKHAAPLFQMANIDISLIVTQRSNQIFDLVNQQPVDQYDGIVCCGGDGTFSELFNGLINRKLLLESTASQAQNLRSVAIDLNNIPRLDKPIGIIPAGSTDTVAFNLNGTSDIDTCIIHIILGQTTGMDISTVSNSNGVIKFYACCMSHGYLGDIAYESEKFRFLGPRRYEFVGSKMVLRNRGYDAEITYLQSAACDPNDGNKCLQNCEICSNTPTEPADEIDESPSSDHWKSIRGKFFMIIGANISCACNRAKRGISPYGHIGDGYVDLLLVRHTSMLNVLKLLLTMQSADRNLADLPFVEIYRTRKFHVKLLNADGGESLADFDNFAQPIGVNVPNNLCFWNCDGEVLQENEVSIRCHAQLIKVYRRGIRRTSDSSPSVDSSPSSSINCVSTICP